MSDPSDSTTTQVQPGSKIGRFVVEDQLGAGGMGLVFAAHDRQLDRRVALKVLRTQLDEDDNQRTRLLREGQAMARITHENVITVHEVGIEGKLVFLAQELLDGGTLGQWLRSPRPQPEILDKFIAAGRGLVAAHTAGLVHRDFKPENVLLGKDGRVRVADFGLARALEPVSGDTPRERPGRIDTLADTQLDGTSPMAQLTRTGAVMGTPLYMAPEQHEGKAADERSDQFSFCVALYQALYGEAPFAGKTAPALADNVLAGRVLPPTKGSNVPARLRKILLRGLSVAPHERFPSMEALLAELARPRGNKGARVALLAGGLAIVVGGAVAGAYVVTSRSDKAAVVEKPVVVDTAHVPDAMDAAAHAAQRALDGDAAFAKGDLNAATEAYEEARGAFEGANDRPRMLALMQRLGDIDVERGKLAEAAQKYVTAGELHQKEGRAPDAAVAWARAAVVRVQQGQLADADALIAKATPLAGADAAAKAQLDLATGQLALARGDLVSASERAKSCAEVPELQPACTQLAADVAADAGDLDAARTAYHRVQKLADTSATRRDAVDLALAQLDLDEARLDEPVPDPAAPTPGASAPTPGAGTPPSGAPTPVAAAPDSRTTAPSTPAASAARKRLEKRITEQRTSAATRAREVLGRAQERGALGLVAQAQLVQAQVALALAKAGEALTILDAIKLDDVAAFRVRTQLQLARGKAKVLVGRANAADADVAAGYDLIQQALDAAKVARWQALVFEALLARAETYADRNQSKTEAQPLTHEATLAGFGRHAALAKKLAEQ